MKMKTGKIPLMIEVNVPPLCKPLLVGNPKGDGLLKWVESPSSKGTVLTWGQDCSVEDILVSMIEMVSIRESKEQWGVSQPDTTSAIHRLQEQGIAEVVVKSGLVFPKESSLLGSVVVAGDRVFPVIHNISRAFCIVEGDP